MIKAENAYAFIGGAFIGRYADLLPTIIISGVILYVADPDIFTWESLNHGKTLVVELLKNITNT